MRARRASHRSGTLSTGVTNETKRSEWESVCEAVNAAGSEAQITQRVKKKKWLYGHEEEDHCPPQNAQTGGGRGEGRLTSFEERVSPLIGTSAISGVVAAHVSDSDHPQGNNLFDSQLHCLNG